MLARIITPFDNAPFAPECPKIEVQIKNVYGEEKIYPVCDKAKVFCAMLQQKTLTKPDIDKIKQLGFRVFLINLQPQTL